MTAEKPTRKGTTRKAPAAKLGSVGTPAPRSRAASGQFTKAAGAKASAAKVAPAKAVAAKAASARLAATKATRGGAAPAKPAARKAASTKAPPTKPAGSKGPATKRSSDAASASTAPAASIAISATEPEGAGDGPIDLYFVRHGDAGDPMTWVGDDAERPLSKKGRRQSKRLGRLLDGLGAQVDVVLSSPKIRATETARLVARGIGAGWEADDRLGSDFGDEALRPLVAGLASGVSSVMLVGHDPDFSRAVSWLVGTSIEMRKGALARVSLPDRNVGAGRGSLRWLLPPDAVAR